VHFSSCLAAFACVANSVSQIVHVHFSRTTAQQSRAIAEFENCLPQPKHRKKCEIIFQGCPSLRAVKPLPTVSRFKSNVCHIHVAASFRRLLMIGRQLLTAALADRHSGLRLIHQSPAALPASNPDDLPFPFRRWNIKIFKKGRGRLGMERACLSVRRFAAPRLSVPGEVKQKPGCRKMNAKYARRIKLIFKMAGRLGRKHC